MRFHHFLVLVGVLAIPSLARAGAPGSVEVTCDLDRTQFRNAARVLSASDSVTFRLWTDETPGLPDTQVGTDYTVPVSALNVIKRYTDRYDHVTPRKTARVQAVIGSDGSPVVLPVDGIAYFDVTVGSTTLGCDHASTNSPTIRRRLHAVAFARESGHAETCETCSSITDVGVGVHNYTLIPVPNVTLTAVPFITEEWDTAAMHDAGDPTKLVAPVAGRYLVTAAIGFVANSVGLRELILHVNGIQAIGHGQQIHNAVGGGQETFLATSAIIDLSAGDYVQAFVSQSSGATLDLYPASQGRMQKVN